ncbi:hypothetical protein RJ41_15055, partial [Alteromonas marina]
EGVIWKSPYNAQVIYANGRSLSPVPIGRNWTLNEDVVIDGDLTFGSNYSLNLNGYTFTVKGNLIQNTGIIDINGGSLIVEGDYRLQ